ncbi:MULTISPECIES: FCD domain-containing protein [unclassified Micromonospora]|uniref:FCD domain-containing protein n=1 Tax=unclassified Micromonospora TaxID=2617518 RepID=UPI003A8BE238
MRDSSLPLAARLCAERITEAELAEAERMQEEMERDPDLGKYVELNRTFHVFLYNAARSPRLTPRCCCR